MCQSDTQLYAPLNIVISTPQYNVSSIHKIFWLNLLYLKWKTKCVMPSFTLLSWDSTSCSFHLYLMLYLMSYFNRNDYSLNVKGSECCTCLVCLTVVFLSPPSTAISLHDWPWDSWAWFSVVLVACPGSGTSCMNCLPSVCMSLCW